MSSKIDKALKRYKTLCCKSEWERKGRADYRCKSCGKDITLELVFLHEALTYEPGNPDTDQKDQGA